MLTKSPILASIALGLTLAACAPKDSGKYHGATQPAIQKGTQTQPQIATQNDQIALALGEFGWARQSSSLSVNPPNLSSQEGCVARRPGKGAFFLREDYDCSRSSDSSDTQTNQRYELSGQQIFNTRTGVYDVSGSFTSRVWSKTSPETLVAQGKLNRQIQILIPTGGDSTSKTDIDDTQLASSAYKMTSTTTYQGDVAQDSNRIPESWTAKMTAGFWTSSATPLKLLTGTQIVFSYLSETDAGTKRAAQVVQLTALSDITFVESDNCLRPVGSFSLSDGTTQVATITTNSTGFALSTEKPDAIHVWGKRCLER